MMHSTGNFTSGPWSQALENRTDAVEGAVVNLPLPANELNAVPLIHEVAGMSERLPAVVSALANTSRRTTTTLRK
jgi:hypothetical protein